MKNTENNNAPIVITIEKHYGNAGKFRLVKRDYLNSKMNYLTRHIVGYYKSDKGVTNKALKIAEKYSEGNYVANTDDAPKRPVEISYADKLSEEQVNKIPEKFKDKLEPLEE